MRVLTVGIEIFLFALFPIRGGSQSIFAGFGDIVNERNVLQMYIPTVNSENMKCRNHSLFYAEELRNLKVWATEMFDASGKMPTGMLYGSSHNIGNFDECVEIKVPYNDDMFYGQYCMAQFTIVPPKDVTTEYGSNYYEKNEYDQYFNKSMWEKLKAYAKDKTKSSRDELYFAICLPSSCTYEDLKVALEENIKLLNNSSDFKLIVDVNKRSCQVSIPVSLSVGDIVFIVFLVLSILIVISSSTYDTLIKKDAYKHLRIKGKLHDIIKCFSFPTNFKKFTAEGRNLDGLDCLAGIRVYSIILITVLHRIMFEFGSPMVNPKYVEKLYAKFETVLLLNGPILVETFFTLSGFLAIYLILGQMKRSKKGFNLGMVYFHRIVRMSPTYAIILAFYCTLLVKLGSGPFWQQKVGLEQERCLASWWANLLYINNYVNTDKICMFQSWYVTCDMNFFFFAPVLAWILWKNPKIGVLLVLTLIIASIVVVFTIVYINKLDAMFMLYIKILKDPVSHDSFKTVYIPAHMRGTSYFVGTLVGFLKHYMDDNEMKIPNNIVKIGWILCAPVMITSLYAGYVFYLVDVGPFFTALYSSLYHFTWSICIAWMVIAISAGYGPWVDPILRWKPLVILGRLTYCVYISHGAIQLYTGGSIRSPVYASIFNLEYKVAADVLLSYVLAFILTMLYESPIIGLEKVLLRKVPAAATKKSTIDPIEDESSMQME
ncbi:nose resistant to fluoxetine protein 6-like [Euwallacea fornicatus]|uniref:nose resistant to fluoxetine protein 6-like n=1 Tax=Euwallacea fornicatus TaxID=995702 RepID=UPI00338ED15D